MRCFGHQKEMTVLSFIARKKKRSKRLPANWNIRVDKEILGNMTNYFGEKRIKVVEKYIENI